MNNRDYKIFAPNSYYHVFNRGNNKQDIFLDKQDHMLFLWRLKEALLPGSADFTPKGRYSRKLLPEGAFNLFAYCLMPNHFHLLIKQDTEIPVSKLITKVCTSYAKYFNKKYERVGQVFQDQFKAIKVEKDSYLLWLSAYIHQNPRVAGLVNNLENWEWGSYLDYIGLRQGKLCDRNFILGMMDKNVEKYKIFVEQSFEKIKERKDLEEYFLE